MQKNPLDNAAVTKLLREGDHAVLRLIYKETWKEFQSWIYSFSRISREETEEIFQESLIIFYEKINSSDFVLSSNWKTFLFAIGKNKLREFLRRNQRNISFDSSMHDSADIDMESEGDESTALVIKCLEELGEPCKSLILAYYYNRMSLEEVSVKLDYKNANSAKNQKFKCMQRLKERFTEQYRPEA